MEKATLRTPFFVVNPKSYLYGDDILALAKKTDELAEKYDFDVLFTAQLIDLPRIIAECPHLIPCAQHMESLKPGRGMGRVLPEALAAAGVRATFLNHAENPLTAHELAAAIARADEVGILTVVCADSVEEGEWIAALGPDVMVCELTGLIGTGRAAARTTCAPPPRPSGRCRPTPRCCRPPASPPAGTCTTPSGAAPTPRAAPPRHRRGGGPARRAGRDARGARPRPRGLPRGGVRP